ncbi:MAG: family NAD(P)-dependent oxidoreductase [Caulobacter sp.]|nr:family NAD(P)-dependent oxidoreductase [Caulobacter sp.]
MNQPPNKPTALITGASSGIGAVYADRLAKRGHDLVLVARDEARLTALAAKLTAETGVKVDVLRADLTVKADLKAVEQRLASDPSIALLINNAGAAGEGGFEGADIDKLEQLIALNVTAVTRLAAAAAQAFVPRGGGAIVNVASVVAYMPEVFPGIYSATKAYVVNLSKSLQAELGPKGLYVQALLPAATATEIWERSGRSVADLTPGTVMATDDLVDAALVGFDRGELITLPSLQDAAPFEALEAGRMALMGGFGNERPAPRYRQVVEA